MSRPTVRQALYRLVARNFLQEKPRKGIFIPAYDAIELSQMYEAMHELEVMCAKLSARRLTLFSRMEIQKMQTECISAAEKGNISLFLEKNEKFHEAIYNSTQNPFLEELVLSFRKRPPGFRYQKYKSKKDLLRTVSDHETLVNFIFDDKNKITEKELFSSLAKPHIESLSINNY